MLFITAAMLLCAVQNQGITLMLKIGYKVFTHDKFWV